MIKLIYVWRRKKIRAKFLLLFVVMKKVKDEDTKRRALLGVY